MRVGSIVIAAGVGIFSFAIVLAASSRLITRWILEYSQDLYFVSTLAALILFGIATYRANIHAGAPTLIRACRVLRFFALMYMIRYLSPRWRAPLGGLVGLFRMWLPLGVAYVFCDPNINKSLDDPYPPL